MKKSNKHNDHHESSGKNQNGSLKANNLLTFKIKKSW